MSKFMILKPRMSEKSYALSQVAKTFVIDVPTDANKLTVAAAVEAQFDGVKVGSVRIVLNKGKQKRTVRKGGRAVMGQRSDVKKAYVTLKEGSLPFFAEVEAAEAELKEKEAKKSAKAKKEEK